MSSSTTTAPATTGVSNAALLRYVFSGFCASLVTIGLARFVYTPLLPVLIQAQWFSASQAVYLGAANLAGYLAGALVGRGLGRRLGNVRALRLMMVLAAASFFACATPLSPAWFFSWRLASGVAGGVVMVLIASTVLPHVPALRRGMASGAIFVGAGLGIAVSGTLVPLLLDYGLPATWVGLGVLSAILCVASWNNWPPAAAAPAAAESRPAAPEPAGPARTGVTALYVEYAFMAAGFVPVMVFLVDFVARGLNAGAHRGGMFWVVYGVGAIIGPALYGWLIDRLGARATLRWVLLSQVLAMAALHEAQGYAMIGVLTLVLGMFPAGLPPMVLSRLQQMIPRDTHGQSLAWSRATIIFATLQAAAGYGYSMLFDASGGDHRLMFVVGAAWMLAALALDMAFSRGSSARA
jgi:predicted MFS family arabinose efflux permease